MGKLLPVRILCKVLQGNTHTAYTQQCVCVTHSRISEWQRACKDGTHMKYKFSILYTATTNTLSTKTSTSRTIDPLSHNHGIKRSQVLSFTTQYPQNRRLSRHQSQSGHFGEERCLLPLPGFEPQIIKFMV
jgi:hypothetical protein